MPATGRDLVNQFLSVGCDVNVGLRQPKEYRMSSSDRNRPNLANGVPPPVGSDAYAAWLERMQRTRGRHAAITKNLYTWSSYKHWADKVKGSWEEEPVPTKK
jgi:hypothetical protein